MTPEAYNALKEWMDFRASFGEKITGDSPLLNCNFISSVDSQIDHRAKIYYPVTQDDKKENNNLFQMMKTNNLSQTHKLTLHQKNI
jgi:hypothetical protein